MPDQDILNALYSKSIKVSMRYCITMMQGFIITIKSKQWRN